MNRLACFATVFVLGACSTPPRGGAEGTELREPASFAPDGLPYSPDAAEFLEISDRLDLNDPRVKFADGTGGMSINLEYSIDGIRGDFLSTNADGKGDNAAGNPEGQIVAYNLSRIFGYSPYYGRARWAQISGRPVAVLHELAKAARPTKKQVIEGKERVLRTTLQSVVTGSLSVYGPSKPLNVSGLERSTEANGVFNTAHPVASLIVAARSKILRMPDASIPAARCEIQRSMSWPRCFPRCLLWMR